MMAIIEHGHEDHHHEDDPDHVLLWLLCDMSAQQADSESFLPTKVSKVSKERNFFFWQLSTSSKKVSKIGKFLQLTKIQLESTVNNCEASFVI